MCGRFTQVTGELPGLETVVGEEARGQEVPPRYNGAPGQDHWLIRYHAPSGENRRDRLSWGLIPRKVKEVRKRFIIARAEEIRERWSFAESYRLRRALLPVDNFFEWEGKKGAKGRQPYAIGLKTREPFAIAAIWDVWRKPGTDDPWLKTFAIVTCEANELVASIHDRMPVIVPPEHYEGWLMNIEPDPRDVMVPYPAELMDMWRVDKRMNRTEVDDAGILDPLSD